MIKVGFIGCGKIAQLRHIPECMQSKNVELYGFFDISKTRREEIAQRQGGKAYDSYESLLADKNINAVIISTPNSTHAEITIAALNAGKDVLCEKPMAVTLAECEQMICAAKETGKKLVIAQNQRLNPAHRRAKELLVSGAIGDVITFKTTFAHSGPDNWSIDGPNSWFWDKNKSCFGSIADLGIHKTDLIVYLLGQRIVKASAVIGTLQKRTPGGELISVDDNAFCTFVMEGGAVGTMNASWTNYGSEDNSTSIFGTKGAMHIYKDPQHSIVIERAGQADEYFDIDAIQTNANQTASGIIDMFVDCIEGNSAGISAEEVLPAMKAVFACEESNNRGSLLIDIK